MYTYGNIWVALGGYFNSQHAHMYLFTFVVVVVVVVVVVCVGGTACMSV